MRHVHPTTVNVIVTDLLDRTNGLLVNAVTNVVKTLHDGLLRLRLCPLGADAVMAMAIAERPAQPGFEARYSASAGSPSWGGHCLSGGPGQTSRS